MPFAATPVDRSTPPLAEWPAGAEVGYVVTPLGGGRAIRVSVNRNGTLEVEGIGTYAIAETVRIAELRAALP